VASRWHGARAAAAGLAVIALSGCTSTLDLEGCRETFATLPVDRAAAREVVPAALQPRIDAQGRAILLMMVQDCAHARLDGIVPITPMRMTHLWIEVDGPEEVGRTLPGTSASLPTAYYFALPHQIDDGLAQAALAAAGISIMPVERIVLGPLADGIRQGEVVEDARGTRYAWRETSEAWPEARVLTGRRRFLSEYGTLAPRSSEGVVVCKSGFLGQGQLDVHADVASTPGRLARGAPLSGPVSRVEMSCSARIRVRYFRNATPDAFAPGSALAEPAWR
jgi:hypothetical protein